MLDPGLTPPVKSRKSRYLQVLPRCTSTDLVTVEYLVPAAEYLVPAAEYQVPEDEYLVPAGEYRWSMHMTAGPGRPVHGSRSHWRLRRKKKFIAR